MGQQRTPKDPSYISPNRETREVCELHGWVGVRAFQRDRHDLCEPPEVRPLDPPKIDEVVDPPKSVDPEAGLPRWSRGGARQRGIPPKKTVAVRRITKLELRAGQAELRALGADEPYDRPKLRSQCRWCPICQLVRDGKSDGKDEVAARVLGDAGPRPQTEVAARVLGDGTSPNAGKLLLCGHDPDTVVFRSRPCVFVSCKHAVYLDVSETGSLILNFPHLEPGQMVPEQSCSLDMADKGGMTLEEIAVVTNLTRERIRQIEMKAIHRRVKPTAVAAGLGAEDVDAADARRSVSPGADLAETGVDGEVPSDVATWLGSGEK